MATTSESTTSIIKSDRVGRSRYSAAYKAEVMAAYAKSGMSGPAFAKQCGIKYPTFASWVSKSKGQPAGPKPSMEGGECFVLAEFSGADTHSTLRVELPGGAIAHAAGTDQVRLLAELLRHLA